MTDITEKTLIAQRIGQLEPLAVRGIKTRPDNRQLSARWLSGTFLTGITSSVLMGVALFAALTTGEAIETPLTDQSANTLRAVSGNGAKGNRLISNFVIPQPSDRQRMELSTLIRSNERSIVRSTPFMLAKIDLAASRSTQRNYPRFDPLKVFQRATSKVKGAEGTIYGAALDSNVTLANSPFSSEGKRFDRSNLPNTDDIERVVRTQAVLLDEGVTQSAALSYINPERFADFSNAPSLGSALNARIVPENVSVSSRVSNADGAADSETFNEIFIPIEAKSSFLDAFAKGGLDEAIAQNMANSLAIVLKEENLDRGMILRASVVTSVLDGETSQLIVRASIYQGNDHVLTVSLNDNDQFVPAREPEIPADLDLATASPKAKTNNGKKSATIYDAIYRSAFAYGATDVMAEQLIKLFASEVDYRSGVRGTDRLEIFFSHPDEGGRATDASAMLYIKAKFGSKTHTFYSFKMADGSVDFFTPEGRSGRPFLLRNPVPSGRFRSGFGMRRHPVTRVYKRHTGVDWSAPRGTPILASGDGVVERAAWAGGYGKQIKLKHANGYVSSYSHQTKFARGIKQGVRVRQGQVIGYVGTTGLSTGNHLHYELIVNGNKVDPMRVRLPVGRVLKGAELERFQDERDRIDALLNEGGDATKLASVN